MRKFLLAAMSLLLLGYAPKAQADSPPPFFLHDGDTVVFYGDSITEQQLYTRDIETYVVTHFPQWHIKFINSGWSGDRVTGGGGGTVETRLKRDVLPYSPTVITLFLGMNDGGYRAYNEPAFQIYTQGLTHIVDELQEQLPGVRLMLLTPSFYDKDAPDAKRNHVYALYNDTLIRYGEFVKKLGADRSIPVVDLNAPMREATRKGRETSPKFALTSDGVHPNEPGHLILAAAILQAWHAPPGGLDMAMTPGIPVTITDPPPWPVPNAARSAFTVSPLPGALDTFQVHFPPFISFFPGTNFIFYADGKAIATLSGPQLEAGVDLTQFPAMPANAQAMTALSLVQDRINTWRYLFKGGPNAIAHAADVPTQSETDALTGIDDWLDETRERTRLAAQTQMHTYLLRAVPVTQEIPEAGTFPNPGNFRGVETAGRRP